MAEPTFNRIIIIIIIIIIITLK